MDHLLAEVRRHEGVTGAENSHYGIYQRQLREQNLSTYFERVTFLSAASLATIDQRLQEVVNTEFHDLFEAEQDDFDDHEAGTPTAFRVLTGGCELDWGI